MLKLKDFKIKEIKTDGLARLTGGQGGPKGQEYYEGDTYARGESGSGGAWTNELWDWDGIDGHWTERDDYEYA